MLLDTMAAQAKEAKVCVICGQPFVPGHLKGHSITCSRECSVARERQTESARRAKRRAERKGELLGTARACAYCGHDFPPTRRDHIYCTPSCKARGSEAKRKPPTRECAHCGKAFVSYATYCGQACAKAAAAKRAESRHAAAWPKWSPQATEAVYEVFQGPDYQTTRGGLVL